MKKIDFPSEYFDPAATLECGQVFRYYPYREGYFVLSGDNACYLYREGAKTVIESEDPDYFFRYFDLSRDYREIYEKALSYGIDILSESAIRGKGIRILRQKEEETIFSFIISQNNHIPRIKSIIEKLCLALGEKRFFEEKSYRTFPGLSVMAEQDKPFFRDLGAGYRDAFLFETARKLTQEEIESMKALPGSSLKKRLLGYKGIGEKVADCICLFGFGKTECFPVDVWIEKTYREDFKGSERDRKKITAYFEELFGEYSGFIQQYLFYAKRNRKR